ncbi:MAG: hypothetical protein HY259_15365 [Chloroflexi bacterium]|nr:hypothetical protein [Chloroflexota bacterium]
MIAESELHAAKALENTAQRLEQQIAAFEKLHADELQRFEQQLTAYRRLQNDELRALRDQLEQLASDIAALAQRAAAETGAPTEGEPVQLTLSRRDFITGHIPSAGSGLALSAGRHD